MKSPNLTRAKYICVHLCSSVVAMKKTVCLGFGFCPEESAHHFAVRIPAGKQDKVLITEYLWYDPEIGYPDPGLGTGETENKLRVMLDRRKWNDIADETRAEFNIRLKKDGRKAGAWKIGDTPLSRLLGKELVLLAWAIEDGDPALTPAAVKNWMGLSPEERWWLYTMTSAATGHALHGRNKGWRKAVRYALTENPVSSEPHETPATFRLLTTDAHR